MRWGRIYAVVGASGVGKDTVMAALAKARPELHWVRRVITRPETAGGEPFEGVSLAAFEARRNAGEFALSWEAHGLHYGIPVTAHVALSEGRDAMFNGSRAMLREAQTAFPGMQVLHITADAAVRAARLAARGRETPDEIARRIARTTPPVPSGLSVTEIDNSCPLERSVAACLAVLDLETA
ncbi:phosphonate metabolism protein/1,5-bisphosphokinase (PRPP-forming) PhnN [Aestuariivita sp.]|jgi:ribose 1,5-bisphosphokinase|uniref:phosphonate metabolism protein/1,5-bisphosphokinase (PRPP-forming) PhnN n=1 Tax=Aestuariivita sp. TaxID=1872407 RepID=UPI0021725092|nr:phosphonate metabolism protein/1,5-bisphosphokinase (PRPP-forming) PhnN [Aestuariivita sp.]MCE8009158.1 phosphonate metabolism protein/1,5-bisphosphokinase (PRPP-forming) PhnN [Aestuariivita sp.]